MLTTFVGRAWYRRLIALAIGLVLGPELLLIVLAIAAARDGYQAIVVQTSSMSPAMEAGDLAIVRSVPPSAVHPGDIITLVEPSPDPLLVPRRVTALVSTASGRAVTTRADRSPIDDPWTVELSNSPIWRTTFLVPGGGGAFSFAHSPAGRCLLATSAVILLVAAALRALRRRPILFRDVLH